VTSTEIAALDGIAAMFDELAHTAAMFDELANTAASSSRSNDWHRGFSDGLRQAYTLSAGTIRNEIAFQRRTA
jgi:hypothetical protein